MKKGQLMQVLDVGIGRHNYSLALAKVLDISLIHTESKGR